MTREQIEHLHRAAKAAKEFKLDPDASLESQFRMMDIFACLVRPEVVEEICEELMNFMDAEWKLTGAEVAESDRIVADAERFQIARDLGIISAVSVLAINRAIARKTDKQSQ